MDNLIKIQFYKGNRQDQCDHFNSVSTSHAINSIIVLLNSYTRQRRLRARQSTNCLSIFVSHCGCCAYTFHYVLQLSTFIGHVSHYNFNVFVMLVLTCLRRTASLSNMMTSWPSQPLALKPFVHLRRMPWTNDSSDLCEFVVLCVYKE